MVASCHPLPMVDALWANYRSTHFVPDKIVDLRSAHHLFISINLAVGTGTIIILRKVFTILIGQIRVIVVFTNRYEQYKKIISA